jgi:uncharacterized membrane protein YhaH (DUF805 family)
MPLPEMLFGLSGRIRRRDFWVWSAVNFVAYLAVALLVFGIFISTALDGSGTGFRWWHNLMSVAVMSPFMWIAVALNIKRLHDIDRSYRWWRINLVPVLGWAWTFFECGLRDGTPGPNRYGPSPKGINDPEQVFE